MGQVAFSSSTSLIVTAAWTPVYTGSWPTSTCTVTKENVGIAFSADARVDAGLNNIQLKNASGVTGTPNALGVDVYFGSRVDSGTRIYSSWVGYGTVADYYFSNGGINVDFDKGWRSDGAASLGNILLAFRAALTILRMATGTITVGAGAPATGPYITLDSSACSTTNPILHVDLNNMNMEVDSAFNTSSGVIQTLDCPYTTVVQYAPQFSLNLDSVWVHAAGQGTSGFNFPTLVMSPANDLALNLHVSNSQLQGGIGSNTSVPFVGLPTLAQMNMTKPNGFYAELDYAPSFWSAGLQNTSSEGPSLVSASVGSGTRKSGSFGNMVYKRLIFSFRIQPSLPYKVARRSTPARFWPRRLHGIRGTQQTCVFPWMSFIRRVRPERFRV